MKLKDVFKPVAVVASLAGCNVTPEQTRVIGEILADGESSHAQQNINTAVENCKDGQGGMDSSILTGGISFTRCGQDKSALHATAGLGDGGVQLGFGYSLPITFTGKPR